MARIPAPETEEQQRARNQRTPGPSPATKPTGTGGPQGARAPNPQATGLYGNQAAALGGGNKGEVGNSAGTGTGINTEQREVATGPFGWAKGGADQYTLDQSLANMNTGGVDAAANAEYERAVNNRYVPDSFRQVTAQQAGQSQFRGQQQGLADMLYQQSMGQGPSAAQSTLQLANDKAINAQMSMARSGGNPAAMRQAMFNAATIGQQNAAEAASLRANEMMAGRSLYANQLQGARGLDDSMSQFNAGQGNQVGLANASNFQQASQQNQAQIQAMLDRAYARADEERRAKLDIAKTNLGIYTGAEQADIAADRGAYAPVQDFVGGFAKAAPGAIMSAVAGMPMPSGGGAPAPTPPTSDFQLKSPWLGR